MPPQVKICGITTHEALQASSDAGVAFAGLVFHPNSPRYLSYAQAADLLIYKPDTLKTVGLFVDPDKATLDAALAQLRLDLIQLHGRESPEYVQEIRSHTNLPIIKALPIGEPRDLDAITRYAPVCDWLLFDAKPAQATDNPGGGGRAFNWSLIRDLRPQIPWMLAGGLNAESVKDALDTVSPDALDVSSGVEKRHGVKDAAKIKTFVDIVLLRETYLA